MFVPEGVESVLGYERFLWCLEVAIVEKLAEMTAAGLVVLAVNPRRKYRRSREAVVGWIETG